MILTKQSLVWVLIGGGVLVLLGVVTATFVIHSPSRNLETSGPRNSPSMTVVLESPFPSPSPTLSPWSYTKTTNVVIGYPTGWHIFKTGTPEDETIFVVTPYAQKYRYPSLLIHSSRISETNTLDSAVSLYDSLGFTKSTATIVGGSAEKYEGFMDRDSAAGGTKRYYQVSYLFEKNKKVFSLEYIYPGTVVDELWENGFQAMIATIQFP
jgi:hypothetical protein